MSTGEVVTETREVPGFDRVTLRDYGELVIMQGDEESLTIEAEGDVLADIETEVIGGRLDIRINASWLEKLSHAITAGLRQQWIKYNLTVKKLTDLEILGASRVRVSKLETDRLGLILGGAGDIKVESLTAENLDVDLRGAGRIGLTGRVTTQRIRIDGAGSYRAPQLGSKKARVDLRGAGKATVWVDEELEIAIHGIGSVEYYGPPTVKKNISGFGSVTHLGNP